MVDPLDRDVTILGTDAYYPTAKDLLSPRVGFSWDVFGNGKTSFRAGSGIFYDQLLPWYYGTVAGIRTPPFFDRGQIVNPPSSTFPNAFALLDPNRSLRQIEDVTPSNTPATVQYNATIQHEVLQNLMLMIGYIGSRGTHIISSADLNTRIPTIQAGTKFFAGTEPARNPFISEHGSSLTSGASRYSGLLLSLNKRFSKGIQFQGNYTWSRATDNASQQFAPEAQNVNRRMMDTDDINRDKSLSAYDVRHNFLGNVSWDLPFGPGKALAGNLSGVPGALLGGWQVNGIVALATGNPLNVEMGFNRARNILTLGIGFQERPDLAPGKSNNPVLGNPDQWMDPRAFQLQPIGTFGNLGRNTVIGPGLNVVDFSLFKNTTLGGERNLQFRAEFFNIFNHANFGTPSRVIFNNATGVPLPTFGRIRNTARTSRQIQFALKYIF